MIDTIDDLQAASRRGDGDRICGEIFTKRLAERVASAADTSCAREARRNLFSPDTSIAIGRDIRVEGDRATVDVTEQDGKVSELSLVKQAGDWRIDSLKPGGSAGP